MSETIPVRRAKAIRRMCLNCVCNSSMAVKCCTESKCALWIYRFGINPNNVHPELLKPENFASPYHLMEPKDHNKELVKLVGHNAIRLHPKGTTPPIKSEEGA